MGNYAANQDPNTGGLSVQAIIQLKRSGDATVVSVSNETLSGLPTIDGVTLSDGEVALLTAQTSADENGPWEVHTGAWTRPSWFPAGSTCASEAIYVQQGTAKAGSLWFCGNVTGSDVVGTDNLSFAQASGPGATMSPVVLTAGSDTETPLTLRQNSGTQSAALLSVEDNAGAVVLAEISASGDGTLNSLVNKSYLEYEEVTAPAVSASGKARLYFDSTAKKLKISEDGGAYADLYDFLTIGDAVSGATANAVCYIDGSGNFANSANFTFSATGLHSKVASTGATAVYGVYGEVDGNTAGDKVGIVGDSAAGGTGVALGVFGFYSYPSGSTVGGGGLFTARNNIALSSYYATYSRASLVASNNESTNAIFVALDNVTPAFSVLDGGAVRFEAAGFLEAVGRSAPAVSSAGEGRIYFDSSTNTFKSSSNGGNYVDLLSRGALFPYTLGESEDGTITQTAPTSDVATNDFTITAQAAYASAVTNLEGADVVLEGGDSVHATGRSGGVILRPGEGSGWDRDKWIDLQGASGAYGLNFRTFADRYMKIEPWKTSYDAGTGSSVTGSSVPFGVACEFVNLMIGRGQNGDASVSNPLGIAMTKSTSLTDPTSLSAGGQVNWIYTGRNRHIVIQAGCSNAGVDPTNLPNGAAFDLHLRGGCGEDVTYSGANTNVGSDGGDVYVNAGSSGLSQDDTTQGAGGNVYIFGGEIGTGGSGGTEGVLHLGFNDTSAVGTVRFHDAYTMPTADGSADQYLKTDGSGNLSWTTISSSGDFANGGDVGGAERTLGNTDDYSVSILANNVAYLRVEKDEIYLGNGPTNASPLTGNIKTASGSGVNVQGADLSLYSGASTGTANPSGINFYSAYANLVSGSTLQTVKQMAQLRIVNGSGALMLGTQACSSPQAADLYIDNGGISQIMRFGGSGSYSTITCGDDITIATANTGTRQIKLNTTSNKGVLVYDDMLYIGATNVTPTARADISAHGATLAALRIRASATTLASPNSGDFWRDTQIGGLSFYDGTYRYRLDTKIRPDDVQTTDATVTTIESIPVASGKTVAIKAFITGTKSDNSDQISLVLHGLFKNASGTTSQIGSTTSMSTISSAGATSGSWDADFTADDTNDEIDVEVTGQAATTINWTTRIEIEEV